uniref:Uncharacterized protein n=1 Tax=Aegilops tauschii TaxID=37682 RepID=M8C6W0_AEGTA
MHVDGCREMWKKVNLAVLGWISINALFGFNSLPLVVPAAVDAVFLGTDLYLGGVLGAALVVVGLYAFLWGKRKELDAAAKGDDREQGLRRGDRDTDDGIA